MFPYPRALQPLPSKAATDAPILSIHVGFFHLPFGVREFSEDSNRVSFSFIVDRVRLQRERPLRSRNLALISVLLLFCIYDVRASFNLVLFFLFFLRTINRVLEAVSCRGTSSSVDNGCRISVATNLLVRFIISGLRITGRQHYADGSFCIRSLNVSTAFKIRKNEKDLFGCSSSSSRSFRSVLKPVFLNMGVQIT